MKHALGVANLPAASGFPFLARTREGENEKLRSLLEPKYRAVGAEPPSTPTWFGLQGSGDSSGIGRKSHGAKGDGVAAGISGGCRRVTALLKTTPLFVMEGTWVKARVVAARSSSGGKDDVTPADVPAVLDAQDPPAPPSSTEPRVSDEGEPESSSALDRPTVTAAAPGEGGQSASDGAAGPARDCLLIQAAVKSLAEVITGVSEAREEEFLKARLPGAQAYVAELERYQSVIVGGKPLRARTGPLEGGGLRGGEAGLDIDDELFRLFGAVETRLYSSPAALGKKPGRVFLTFSTLWFHSKVGTRASLRVLFVFVFGLLRCAAALNFLVSLMHRAHVAVAMGPNIPALYH